LSSDFSVREERAFLLQDGVTDSADGGSGESRPDYAADPKTLGLSFHYPTTIAVWLKKQGCDFDLVAAELPEALAALTKTKTKLLLAPPSEVSATRASRTQYGQRRSRHLDDSRRARQRAPRCLAAPQRQYCWHKSRGL
jgi:hypothetical protein